jgi:hypothetical protein
MEWRILLLLLSLRYFNDQSIYLFKKKNTFSSDKEGQLSNNSKLVLAMQR